MKDQTLIATFGHAFDVLAIANTTWQKPDRRNFPMTFIRLAPHTGQSSQLFLDHNHRSAWFLPSVARKRPKLASHSESRALAHPAYQFTV